MEKVWELLSIAMERLKGRIKSVPLPLLVTGLCLGLWGCVAVYNSTFFTENPYFTSLKQGVWLLISFGALFICALIPSRFYLKAAPWLAVLSLLPLWGLLFWGHSVHRMRGWYDFGSLLPGSDDPDRYLQIFMQPSELAKPFFIITMVLLLARNYQQKWCVREDLLTFTIAEAWLIPIALQPDYGTLVVYCLTLAFIFWGMGGRLIMLFSMSTVFLSGLLWILMNKPYVLDRFRGYISPEQYADSSGYHISQFQKTLANGGPWGRDLGHARWSELFLPNAHHDSVFASFGESVGFVGLLPVFIIILYLLYFLLRRAWNLDDMRKAGIVYGLIALLAIQSLIHISVSVGVLPPTGITMPFLSYGGSSLMATMISFGIIISMLQVDKKLEEGIDCDEE